MNLNHAHPGRPSRAWTLMTLFLVALLATACGPWGDDEDPTSTSETLTQPTTEPDEATSPVGTAATVDGTPAGTMDEIANLIEDVSTPDAASAAAEDGAPPLRGDTAVISTPTVAGLDGEEDDATPVAADDTQQGTTSPAPFTGSDGTSGATPPGEGSGTETEQQSVPDSTPGGTPGLAVLEVTATPVGNVDLDAIEPVEADSCEPSDVPVLADGALSYITTTAVNFRTGPGSDCDTIGDGPLGPDIPVTVLSAPMVRVGEEEYIWVQIRVNDITGWVIVEAIEPVA